MHNEDIKNSSIGRCVGKLLTNMYVKKGTECMDTPGKKC